MTTWCTAADVLKYAKTTVTDDDVTVAGGTVDVHCARPYDIFVAGVPVGQVCKISVTDLYWLRLTCAWQAAWLSDQPDAFSRSDVTSIGRGTGSLTIAEKALTLAPLAKLALNRVSYLKSRSLHTPGPMELNALTLDGDGPGWKNLGPI